MPTYDFLNTKTGKKFTEFMSISEKEDYLKKNTHIKQQIGKINIVSGVMGMGSLKSDGGWKDNLSRIAEAHPTSPFAQQYGKKSTKQIKTEQAISKHRKRQRGK